MSLKLNHSRLSVALGLAALGLAAAHPAAAQTTTVYNFEVQGDGSGGSTTPYAGTGALAGAGTTWNLADASNHVYISATGYSGNIITDALDSNGNSSTVGFSAESDNVVTEANDGNASSPDQLFSNYANNNKTTPKHIEFTNLAPDAAFTLDLYAEDGNEGFRGADFILTDAAGNPLLYSDVENSGVSDTTFQMAPTTTDGHAVDGVSANYAQFTGMTDALGDVYVTYGDTRFSGGAAEFNGAQIAVTVPAATPEPSELSAMALAAAGLGGLMLTARKRRAASRPC